MMRRSSNAPIAQRAAAKARKTQNPLANGRRGAARRNAAVALIIAMSAAKTRIETARLTGGS
jgi:hypothetical protein